MQPDLRRISLLLATGASLLLGHASASATDWIVKAAHYTHEPTRGYRVNQYAPIPEVYHTPDPNRSVYYHSRSTLQVGDTASYYHRVQQYGAPVRPYDEWRFPFRPFSVPYPLWGPQPMPWGGGWGWGGGVGGGGGGIGSPFGPYGVVNGSGFPPPWNDGTYPDITRQPAGPMPLPAPPGIQIDNTINGDGNQIQN